MLLATHTLSLLLPTIWIVDAANGPGTHFLDLPAAVAAAASGDTILVRAGSYSNLYTNGKQLTVRGAGSATTFLGTTYIDGPDCVLAGVTVRPSQLVGTQLSVYSQLTMLHCRVEAVAPNWSTAALLVGSNAYVSATDCDVRGSNSPISVVGGGGAVLVAASGVFVATDCTLRGGDGLYDPITGSSSSAGHALRAIGVATLHRTTCIGGDCTRLLFGTNRAGDAIASQTQGGVRVAGTASTVLRGGVARDLATNPVPVACGRAFDAQTGNDLFLHGAVQLQPAAPGAPLFSNSGATALPALPYLTVQSPALPSGENDAAQLAIVVYDGLLPNAPYVFAAGFTPAFSTALAPALVGELLVDLDHSGLLFGTLDGAGQFTFPLLPAAALASVLGHPIYAQCATFDVVAGNARASNLDARIYSL